MMSKCWGFANIIGEKLYLIVGLVSISLIMKVVEHFFIGVRVICIPFSMNCLLISLVKFS